MSDLPAEAGLIAGCVESLVQGRRFDLRVILMLGLILRAITSCRMALFLSLKPVM